MLRSTPDNLAPPVGRLETAVVGDVHGCGEALARLLDRLDSVAPQARVILVGDLLTKGPEPERVVELLRSRAAAGRPTAAVCGNHDRRMLAALVGVERGLPIYELPASERRCFEALDRAGGTGRPVARAGRPGAGARWSDLVHQPALEGRFPQLLLV
ncbi:MAG: metallophosphoesterase, partial [Phycisphaerales bacterium]